MYLYDEVVCEEQKRIYSWRRDKLTPPSVSGDFLTVHVIYYHTTFSQPGRYIIINRTFQIEFK